MNYFILFKKVTVVFMTMMMSTTLAFANHTYVSEDVKVDQTLLKITEMDFSSEKNIKLLKSKSLEGQKKIIKRIDKLIAKEQKRASRSSFAPHKSISKFERKMDRRLNKEAKQARRLLNNERRLTRLERKMAKNQDAHFDAKAFRERLKDFTDDRVLDEAKEQVMNQVHQAGSMEEFYKVLKTKINEHNQAAIVSTPKTTSKATRAPASIQVDWSAIMMPFRKRKRATVYSVSVI
jgi:hypothetical protein